MHFERPKNRSVFWVYGRTESLKPCCTPDIRATLEIASSILQSGDVICVFWLSGIFHSVCELDKELLDLHMQFYNRNDINFCFLYELRPLFGPWRHRSSLRTFLSFWRPTVPYLYQIYTISPNSILPSTSRFSHRLLASKHPAITFWGIWGYAFLLHGQLIEVSSDIKTSFINLVHS
jgi:hypothetical protein